MTGSAPAAPTPASRRAAPAPAPESEPEPEPEPAPAEAEPPPEPGPPVAEFVDEELPPGFWDDDPPAADDRAPRPAVERPAAPRSSRGSAVRRLPEDPFEAVQQLFPGRTLMVEASADDPEPGVDDGELPAPDAPDDDA